MKTGMLELGPDQVSEDQLIPGHEYQATNTATDIVVKVTYHGYESGQGQPKVRTSEGTYYATVVKGKEVQFEFSPDDQVR